MLQSQVRALQACGAARVLTWQPAQSKAITTRLVGAPGACGRTIRAEEANMLIPWATDYTSGQGGTGCMHSNITTAVPSPVSIA